MTGTQHEERDPIAAKFKDTAMLQKLVRQAVREAVDKARRLGFLGENQEQPPSLPRTGGNSIRSNIAAEESKVKPMSTLLDEINQLDIAERIQLVEDLWDSVALRTSEFPISDVQKAELDRRLARHRSDPQRGVTLDQIAQKLGVKL